MHEREAKKSDDGYGHDALQHASDEDSCESEQSSRGYPTRRRLGVSSSFHLNSCISHTSWSQNLSLHTDVYKLWLPTYSGVERSDPRPLSRLQGWALTSCDEALPFRRSHCVNLKGRAFIYKRCAKKFFFYELSENIASKTRIFVRRKTCFNFSTNFVHSGKLVGSLCKNSHSAYL